MHNKVLNLPQNNWRNLGSLMVLALLMLLVLSACGDTATSSSSSAATTTAASAATTTTSAATTTTASATTTTAATAAGSATTTSAATGSFNGKFDGQIKFGAAISLTGSTSNEGKYTRDGYELWKDTYNAAGGIVLNGKHYEIVTKYYDDESNQQKSATLYDTLINTDKVDFLLGPYGTASTQSDSAVAEKNKIPMVEANGAAQSIFSKGYKYTFGVLSPAKNYLTGIVDMALTQNPKPSTVAILSADDSFSLEVANAVQDYAKSKGLSVVYFQKYHAVGDISAQLTEVKGKNPDIFLNSGHLEESLAIMQQAKQLSFSPKAFGFSVGPSAPDFYNTLKGDANYVYGGTQWTPALKFNGDDLFKTPDNYNTMFNAKYGYLPPYQSAESSAAGVVYVKAIEAAGSLDHTAVRDALAKTDVTTFYGHIAFDSTGINSTKPMAVEQWQNGKKVTVWPQDAANGKPMWPTPPWSNR